MKIAKQQQTMRVEDQKQKNLNSLIRDLSGSELFLAHYSTIIETLFFPWESLSYYSLSSLKHNGKTISKIIRKNLLYPVFHE